MQNPILLSAFKSLAIALYMLEESF